MGYDRFFKYRYRAVNKWIDKYEFEELSRNILGAAIKVGLLLNFAKPTLEIKRIVY